VHDARTRLRLWGVRTFGRRRDQRLDELVSEANNLGGKRAGQLSLLAEVDNDRRRFDRYLCVPTGRYHADAILEIRHAAFRPGGTRPFSASVMSYPRVLAIVFSGKDPSTSPWTNSKPLISFCLSALTVP
jgi:hypothetical protein